MEKDKILVINLGTTSTKVAVFKEQNKIMEESVSHSKETLDKYKRITDQFEFRMHIVMEILQAGNLGAMIAWHMAKWMQH